MSNHWSKGIILTCCLQFFIPVFLIGQTIYVTGHFTKRLENKKSIYHHKNKHAREEMIREAVLDAVGQAPHEKISVIEDYRIKSSRSQSYEEIIEDFISQSLIEKHVEWRRTSSYQFARDSSDNKTWICEVDGEIRSIKNKPYGSNQADIKTTANPLNNFITRKRYNVAYLNAGETRGVEKGDKFITYRNKRVKNIGGSYWIPKKKGFIVITDVYDNFSIGRVVKGVFTTSESQQAAKIDFQTTRLGIEYRLSGSHEQIYRWYNPFGIEDTSALIDTYTHSLYFFQYGLVSHTGFKLGFEVYDTDTKLENSDSLISAYCFVPKIDFNFAFGLVPDFLYIQPSVALGYLFTDISEENRELHFGKPKKGWGADVVLESDISLHLRLWHFDIIGGVTYKYINDLPDLSNYYPHVGLSYNFVRYARDNFDVK